MPYDDPDPSDPQMLVGVVLPGRPETMREMAVVFADEFARIGYSAAQILGMFTDPFYAGAHAALRVLGEAAIRQIIAESVVRWPAVRIVEPAPKEGAKGGAR